MFKVVKVTDRNGDLTTGVGAKALGYTVAGVKSVDDVRSLRGLVIPTAGGRFIHTSRIESVNEQVALFGPDTIEVVTCNSVYYLEPEMSVV